MIKLLKPANIAFYFLMPVFFFFVGIYAALLVGAGKNQMLAGGAIVLCWGIIFSAAAFICSLFIAHYTRNIIIVRLDWILLILLIILYGITHSRYLERRKEQRQIKTLDQNENIPKPSTRNLRTYASSSWGNEVFLWKAGPWA